MITKTLLEGTDEAQKEDIGEYIIQITAADPYGHSTTLIVTITVSAGSV